MRSRVIGLVLAAMMAVAVPTGVTAQVDSPYAALNLPQGQLNGQQAMTLLTLLPIQGTSYVYTYRRNGTWTAVASRAGANPQTIAGTFQITADGQVIRREGSNQRTFTIERGGNFYYQVENGDRNRIQPAG